MWERTRVRMFVHNTSCGNMSLFLETLVLASLATWLVARHRQRIRMRAAQYEAWLKQEVPRAESSLVLQVLTPRIHQVREEYLAEVKTHPRRQSQKDALVVPARVTVRQRAFFHEEEMLLNIPSQPAVTRAAG